MSTVFARSQAECYEKHKGQLPGSCVAAVEDIRDAALQRFLARGLPNNRVERWKYTSLKSIENRAFGSFLNKDNAEQIAKVCTPEVVGENDICFYFYNGQYCEELTKIPDHARDKIRTYTLDQVLSQSVPEFESFFTRMFSCEEESLTDLNLALCSGGLGLVIEENACLSSAINFVFIGASAQQDSAAYLRNFLIVGASASATIIEHYVGNAPHHNLSNIVNQWHLKEDAQLKHVRVQNESRESSLFIRHDSILESKTSLNATVLDFGARLSHVDQRFKLLGSDASVHVKGLSASDQHSQSNQQICVEHYGVRGTCHIQWRCVADDEARIALCGHLVVHPQADFANTQLHNKNLLLSANAEINTKPVLEIYTDEVKASHGATVGQLDELALFYLQSRGIPYQRARAMLIEAFCGSLCDASLSLEMQNYINQKLQASVLLKNVLTAEQVER
jgi:Fe-S cluster assembly protein SufD